MKHSHHASRDEAKARGNPERDVAGLGTAVHDGDMDLQIREAAYYRYLARGAELGHDLEDWLQAESDLLGKGDSQVASH
jgi:hypothetical protein